MTYDIPKIDIECDKFIKDNNSIFGYPRHEYRFENGYGASVVNNQFSCGLELAVLKKTPLEIWMICYDTEITNDVVRHISGPDELRDLLERINGLKS